MFFKTWYRRRTFGSVEVMSSCGKCIGGGQRLLSRWRRLDRVVHKIVPSVIVLSSKFGDIVTRRDSSCEAAARSFYPSAHLALRIAEGVWKHFGFVGQKFHLNIEIDPVGIVWAKTQMQYR